MGQGSLDSCKGVNMNTYSAGTKGDDLLEAKDSAELASIK